MSALLTCSTCKEIKPFCDFYKNVSRPTGHAGQCKRCADISHTRRDRAKRRMNGDPKRTWPSECLSIRERLVLKSAPKNKRGCILWLGATSHGYGVLRLFKKNYLAHRLAFEIANEPITNGMHVLHKCDVPRCMNPEHLYLGTPKDNARDVLLRDVNPRLKLKADDIPKIRKMLADGMHFKKIAEQFKVPSDVIGNIKWGRTWKCL